MQLQIVDGDLLDQDVEVIVNAWNRKVSISLPGGSRCTLYSVL